VVLEAVEVLPQPTVVTVVVLSLLLICWELISSHCLDQVVQALPVLRQQLQVPQVLCHETLCSILVGQVVVVETTTPQVWLVQVVMPHLDRAAAVLDAQVLVLQVYPKVAMAAQALFIL
jgi:hypothetical protein